MSIGAGRYERCAPEWCYFKTMSPSYPVKSHHNYRFVMGKVGCLVYIVALLVGFLGGSVLKVDLSGSVKKKRATSGFGLKLILRRSLCVSGPCTLQLSCGIISGIA